MWSPRVLISAGCLLACGCGSAAAAAPPAASRFGIQIQAIFDDAGNPSLAANFRPDAHAATPRWDACPHAKLSSCEPGRTPAGTVFTVRAMHRGRTYVARTAPWRGTVHPTSRPRLRGAARVGARVRAVAGRWGGGWGGEFDHLRVQACRTRDARRCVTVSPEVHRSATVRARYVGWYLFAFDERFARDTVFATPAYGRPEGIPPVHAGPTVSRSAPAGPVTR